MSGTLTKNEQTVTELYTVDETTTVDPSSTTASTANPSIALLKTLQIGSLCNNAVYRHEEAAFVGHSVDVALLNVLPVFGLSDQRVVCSHHAIFYRRFSQAPGLYSTNRATIQL